MIQRTKTYKKQDRREYSHTNTQAQVVKIRQYGEDSTIFLVESRIFTSWNPTVVKYRIGLASEPLTYFSFVSIDMKRCVLVYRANVVFGYTVIL